MSPRRPAGKERRYRSNGSASWYCRCGRTRCAAASPTWSPMLGTMANHVWLSNVPLADGVDILIDDDGPGIPAAERERVFQPFIRLDTSRNPSTGGVGLGLTIARDVARSHGGDVRLETSPYGGLRARVHLPR